ncbi:sulfite exporter TauE/SafE family protein [Parendozoicomonas sp. Alg238-R29]|uniref:sulfite exporter TauE/SafE family protein n=1 Tax=Parendozoicomonas sp. Alg238-R29 TaxID=2993446 RepID=UPI00248E1BE1|nr:sulfite exporter TauE/SafE family protein [Parendozoicomonas sp. Alg238-R29]
MYELTLVNGIALLLAGVVAGFINTIAGGGSMLTLPALMLLGMPADIANATNRVGVMFQSITGLKGFHKEKKLDTGAMVSIVVPTLIGSAVGAVLASWLPVDVLKPVLLGSMVAIALVMVMKPSTMRPTGEHVRTITSHPQAAIGLFLAGVYGGFLQAGVGFMLLAALAGSLRYDLVRANALKILCTGAFTAVALGIFIWNDLILWVPGLILALGSSVGAHFSVKFAVTASQKTLSWILFVMVLLASGAAWFS